MLGREYKGQKTYRIKEIVAYSKHVDVLGYNEDGLCVFTQKELASTLDQLLKD